LAAICRGENIAPSLFYKWNKDFLDASKKRKLGGTMREANISEIKALREENRDLKEVVIELTLKNRVLKKA